MDNRPETTFDERARDWDSRERIDRAASAAAAIRSAVPLGPNLRVIEGAGTGLLALSLAHEAGSIVLTDPSCGRPGNPALGQPP